MTNMIKDNEFTCTRCGQHDSILRTIYPDIDSSYPAYPARYFVYKKMCIEGDSINGFKIDKEKLCFECKMYLPPIWAKDKVFEINGIHDLGITHREFIGGEVIVVRVKKNGLVLCKTDDGVEISIPKLNLTIKKS